MDNIVGELEKVHDIVEDNENEQFYKLMPLWNTIPKKTFQLTAKPGLPIDKKFIYKNNTQKDLHLSFQTDMPKVLQLKKSALDIEPQVQKYIRFRITPPNVNCKVKPKLAILESNQLKEGIEFEIHIKM